MRGETGNWKILYGPDGFVVRGTLAEYHFMHNSNGWATIYGTHSPESISVSHRGVEPAMFNISVEGFEWDIDTDTEENL